MCFASGQEVSLAASTGPVLGAHARGAGPQDINHAPSRNGYRARDSCVGACKGCKQPGSQGFPAEAAHWYAPCHMQSMAANLKSSPCAPVRLHQLLMCKFWPCPRSGAVMWPCLLAGMVLALPPAPPPAAGDESEDRAGRQHSARMRTSIWCEVS